MIYDITIEDGDVVEINVYAEPAIDYSDQYLIDRESGDYLLDRNGDYIIGRQV